MHNYKPFASDDDIASIAQGLLNRTLPKTAWTHAAHFAAAIWLLSSRHREEVSVMMPGLIRAYNEATGVPNTDSSGYHETITQASIRAAWHFSHNGPTQPLHITCNRLMASPLGKPDWLLNYWSRDRLFSVEARRAWLDPDIRPLPF